MRATCNNMMPVPMDGFQCITDQLAKVKVIADQELMMDDGSDPMETTRLTFNSLDTGCRVKCRTEQRDRLARKTCKAACLVKGLPVEMESMEPEMESMSDEEPEMKSMSDEEPEMKSMSDEE